MLIHPTIDNMRSLRLFAMVQALQTQMEMKDIEEMNFTDRLGLLVDAELIARENNRLQSRLRTAKLRLSACIEDLDIKAARGLDRTVVTALATSDWLKRHQNVIVTGATGAGQNNMLPAPLLKKLVETAIPFSTNVPLSYFKI